jgi:hypothetical protein
MAKKDNLSEGMNILPVRDMWCVVVIENFFKAVYLLTTYRKGQNRDEREGHGRASSFFRFVF